MFAWYSILNVLETYEVAESPVTIGLVKEIDEDKSSDLHFWVNLTNKSQSLQSKEI